MRARWAAWWPRTAEWPRPNRKATWNARSDEWWLTARRRTTPSVRFTTGVIRAPETGRKHVTLAQGHHDQDARVDPRTGPPPWRPGPLESCPRRLRRDAGRWYCAFTVDVARHVRAPALT